MKWIKEEDEKPEEQPVRFLFHDNKKREFVFRYPKEGAKINYAKEKIEDAWVVDFKSRDYKLDHNP